MIFTTYVNLCCPLQADEPAAEEWQLSWEGRPSKGHQHSAASMLRSLYVNPVGAGLPHLLHIPPLRLVPFTLILRTKHLRLGICLDDSLLADTASSMLQEDSILADVRDLQVLFRQSQSLVWNLLQNWLNKISLL